MSDHTRELSMPVGAQDHVLGPANAPVTLLEYGDYECPYCAKAFPVVKRLAADFGPKLRVVFRHFPQNSVHPQAGVAAQVAEAAAAQGKFWEMHDLLYENQEKLAEIDFTHFALKLGLEVYRFQSDLEREIFAPHVAEDFRGGLRSGVSGTPAFFINALRYEGEPVFEPMREAIERAAAG